MTTQNLIIFNLPVLFEVLDEIKDNFNFKITNIENKKDFQKIQNDIFKDKNNLYYMTKGKFVTKINKLRLNNIKDLSVTISRINNIIFFS